MEGITILETQPAYEINLFGLFILIFGLMLLVITVISIVELNLDELGMFLIPIGSCSIIVSIVMLCIPIHSSNKAIYTIRIEEKVDLNEFLNKYEIISHEKYSNIYKIKGDIINNKNEKRNRP